ncbi:MAG: hypothetical protein IJW90_00205 [Clostridia bacterium]|nr:hypothetical protein [Clostridia bacterium]
MTKLFIQMAGFRIVMEANYDYVRHQCAPYLKEFPLEDADFYVSASPKEVAKEISVGEKDGLRVSEGYAESICLYRALCTRLPEKDAMLMHAAVISDGKYAYAFTAPSGTGKSTHIRLWRQAFGEDIFVINGDKPILRLMDGVWWVYGTPWCGKEGWQTNIGMPLTAICLLSRGEENRITDLSPTDAVLGLMHQILLSNSPDMARAQMQLLNSLVTKVPLYALSCTVSEEAAHVARAAMTP